MVVYYIISCHPKKNRPHALAAELARLMPKTCSLHMCVRVRVRVCMILDVSSGKNCASTAHTNTANLEHNEIALLARVAVI